MKKINIALLIISLIVVFGAGFLVGWQIAQPSHVEKTVTADIILTSLHKRGFLVTQTFIFNEPVEIENKEGVFWKDLLFGQTITARGTVEVNLGVDLQKVQAEDVDITSQKITVTLPSSEIFNSRLVGSIDVTNKQGVLKRLLDNDDGYNQALQELTALAEDAAMNDELLSDADKQAQEEVSRLLELVVPEREIEVIIKPQPTEQTEDGSV